jgi:hypothetical protein
MVSRYRSAPDAVGVWLLGVTLLAGFVFAD